MENVKNCWWMKKKWRSALNQPNGGRRFKNYFFICGSASLEMSIIMPLTACWLSTKGLTKILKIKNLLRLEYIPLYFYCGVNNLRKTLKKAVEEDQKLRSSWDPEDQLCRRAEPFQDEPCWVPVSSVCGSDGGGPAFLPELPHRSSGSHTSSRVWQEKPEKSLQTNLLHLFFHEMLLCFYHRDLFLKSRIS